VRLVAPCLPHFERLPRYLARCRFSACAWLPACPSPPLKFASLPRASLRRVGLLRRASEPGAGCPCAVSAPPAGPNSAWPPAPCSRLSPAGGSELPAPATLRRLRAAASDAGALALASAPAPAPHPAEPCREGMTARAPAPARALVPAPASAQRLHQHRRLRLRLRRPQHPRRHRRPRRHPLHREFRRQQGACRLRARDQPEPRRAIVEILIVSATPARTANRRRLASGTPHWATGCGGLACSGAPPGPALAASAPSSGSRSAWPPAPCSPPVAGSELLAPATLRWLRPAASEIRLRPCAGTDACASSAVALLCRTVQKEHGRAGTSTSACLGAIFSRGAGTGTGTSLRTGTSIWRQPLHQPLH
jgi:hypothetical protein